MPKQQNIDSVSNLSAKAAKAKAIYLTDYRGLTHKQLESLHKSLKDSDAEYVVVKNSLLNISLKTNNFRLPKGVGPTAALFAYGDEITPLKELSKFIKTNTKPAITGGSLGGRAYTGDEVVRLSKLPTKMELYGQVVSRVSGPMYGLVYALQGNIQKLVTVLGRIQK